MKKIKILIVDDNQECCESIEMLFSASGHHVKVAFDGESAIVVALNFLPDVILLDIGMPNMNGWQVARILRRNILFQKTKIFALTGYGSPSDIRQSHEAGMDFHFTKPLDPDDFEIMLQKQGVF